MSVNGREYAAPRRPTVVVCLDGTNAAYLEAAAAAGAAPFLARLLKPESCLEVSSVVPSLTNPNNVSIVTGVPPAIHGISGNYFRDREQDAEVLMNSPAYLRTETILSAFSRAGFRVAAVTAKDKLRLLLGHKLQGICFSAECASSANLPENGIADVPKFVGLPEPSVYSEEISVFVLQAGLRLLEADRPDLMYLSTTDYVQHKFAPGSAEANRLFATFDPLLRRMHELGAALVLTADHGMSAKTNPDGTPRCLYLTPFLDNLLGQGAARVVLPITDPYVTHHGALGSFASLYLAEPFRAGPKQLELVRKLALLPGVEQVHDNREASARFNLPSDRLGDIVVLADGGTVLGKDEKSHDLSLLDRPLRSHGGLAESRVPLLSNGALSPTADLRHNYDAFYAALNAASFDSAG